MPYDPLSAEQREIRDLVRTLARERIAPRAAAIDESHEFPWDIVELYREHGLFGLFFGEGRKPDFWLAQRGKPGTSHVAIRSNDRAAVDAFHEAALAAGGKDNGPPGLRPHYHETYYSAFVLDPEGNNIEAVCHSPE